MARDLARRVLGVGAGPGTPAPAEVTTSNAGASDGDASNEARQEIFDVRETDAPPSARLQAQVFDHFVGLREVQKPWGRACDWEDADGRPILWTLRMLTRSTKTGAASNPGDARF